MSHPRARASRKGLVLETIRAAGPLAFADLVERVYPISDTHLKGILAELVAEGRVAAADGTVTRTWISSAGNPVTRVCRARVYSSRSLS